MTQPIFRCEVCGRMFASHGAISTHDRSHSIEERMASIGRPQEPREPITSADDEQVMRIATEARKRWAGALRLLGEEGWSDTNE